MTRSALFVVFVVAEAWQFVFGAGTSLALGNPAVGEQASWAPNVLVDEAFTVLPIGFLLCLWGAPWGRRLAPVCAAASLVLAFAASVAVSARPLAVSEFAIWFALLAVPGLALIVCVLRTRRASSPDPTS